MLSSLLLSLASAATIHALEFVTNEQTINVRLGFPLP